MIKILKRILDRIDDQDIKGVMSERDMIILLGNFLLITINSFFALVPMLLGYPYFSIPFIFLVFFARVK